VIANLDRVGKSKKASASFLKKRSKKFLFAAGPGSTGANAPRTESFLLLFFKKEALSFAQIFSTSFPKFSPENSFNSVSGNVSSPSTTSSRPFSLPAAIQPAISRAATP